MVKDIPIPKFIFHEFRHFTKSKKVLAEKFDHLDLSFLKQLGVKEDMPGQIKGQKYLDKYFTKVTLKESSNSNKEMGKNSISFNTSNNISGSASESEKTVIKSSNKKHHTLSDQELVNQKSDIDKPFLEKSKIPSIANVSGLKQRISENYQDYDSSSNDSGALVIDEEADVENDYPVQTQSSRNEVTIKNTSSHEKITSPKKDSTRAVQSSRQEESKKQLENETLTMSQFLNAPANIASKEAVNKFSTSTPVDKTTKKRKIQNDDSPEQPISKKNKTYENDCENTHSGVNLETMTELVDFDEENCSLFLEDLESDDEMFVVQCPKEVVPEKLVGKKLALNGETLLKLNVNGEKRPYESFSQMDSMGRHVYMIVPSRNEKMLKFGMYQLKGSVVMSEGLDITEDSLSENKSDQETEYHHSEIDNLKVIKKKKKDEQLESDSENQNKSKKHSSLPIDNLLAAGDENNCREQAGENKHGPVSHNEFFGEPEHDEDMMSTTVIKKKKKKKEKYEDRRQHIEYPEQVRFDDDDAMKMKNRKDEEKEIVRQEKNYIEDLQRQCLEKLIVIKNEENEPHKKKKKKKHKNEEKELKVVSKTENIKTEEICLVEEENYSLPVKKKKKKLDKAEDSVEDSVKTFMEPEMKKKKKHKEQAIVEQPAMEEPQPKKKKKKYDVKITAPLHLIKNEESHTHRRNKKTYEYTYLSNSVNETTYKCDGVDERMQRVASERMPFEDFLDGIKMKKKKKKKKRESSID